MFQMNSELRKDIPPGAAYYRERAGGKIRIIARGAPPKPGDQLCRMLTGHSENEIVRRILNGEYDELLGVVREVAG